MTPRGLKLRLNTKLRCGKGVKYSLPIGLFIDRMITERWWWGGGILWITKIGHRRHIWIIPAAPLVQNVQSAINI